MATKVKHVLNVSDRAAKGSAEARKILEKLEEDATAD